MGLYIGPTYEVRGNCLRTLTRMEIKGICLCKQATNVEDSSRTIVRSKAKEKERKRQVATLEVLYNPLVT